MTLKENPHWMRVNGDSNLWSQFAGLFQSVLPHSACSPFLKWAHPVMRVNANHYQQHLHWAAASMMGCKLVAVHGRVWGKPSPGTGSKEHSQWGLLSHRSAPANRTLFPQLAGRQPGNQAGRLLGLMNSRAVCSYKYLAISQSDCSVASAICGHRDRRVFNEYSQQQPDKNSFHLHYQMLTRTRERTANSCWPALEGQTKEMEISPRRKFFGQVMFALFGLPSLCFPFPATVTAISSAIAFRNLLQIFFFSNYGTNVEVYIILNFFEFDKRSQKIMMMALELMLMLKLGMPWRWDAGMPGCWCWWCAPPLMCCWWWCSTEDNPPSWGNKQQVCLHSKFLSSCLSGK